MELRLTLGRNVRRVRQAQRLTIEALADEARLSYSYVGELERGRRNPTLAIVERLASALKVQPHRLRHSERRIRMRSIVYFQGR